MHGVVRTRPWEVVDQSDAKVVMRIRSNDETRASWPNDFELTLAITVADKLIMAMTAKNTSNKPFVFEEALHTYYSVGDVRNVRLFGLTGATYVDRVVSPEQQIDRADPLTFARGLDRVYTGTTANCVIEDPQLKRKISIEKENSKSAIVWNPWDEKIKTMPDLAPDDWIKYICVETGNVKGDAITLPPGQSHTMTLRISSAGLR
jgi:D-hexose-6-phosphate mutarotase